VRFTWNKYPDREFNGPSVRLGLLGGFTTGELRWAKEKLFKVARIEDVDAADSRVGYYFLTLRRADHTLAPVDVWADLSGIDFDLVPHEVTVLDADGDCGECNQPLANEALHTGVNVPPMSPAAPTPS
jgi:hypothetical protein